MIRSECWNKSGPYCNSYSISNLLLPPTGLFSCSFTNCPICVKYVLVTGLRAILEFVSFYCQRFIACLYYCLVVFCLHTYFLSVNVGGWRLLNIGSWRLLNIYVSMYEL
jgi:hypothetical protein